MWLQFLHFYFCKTAFILKLAQLPRIAQVTHSYSHRFQTLLNHDFSSARGNKKNSIIFLTYVTLGVPMGSLKNQPIWLSRLPSYNSVKMSEELYYIKRFILFL